MAADAEASDPTALYTFLVGQSGHPFHRHDGHRVFTAVSGSGGTLIRFSFASDKDLLSSPECFLDMAEQIKIPPDCLFSVRFGRGVWHQFTPILSGHPALFALSCHTEEKDELKRCDVAPDDASIAALTSLLPQGVTKRLTQFAWENVRTTSLSLDAGPNSVAAKLCGFVRSRVGPLLTKWPGQRTGFVDEVYHGTHASVSSDSLVRDALPSAQYLDAYQVQLKDKHNPRILMGRLLRGFVLAPPKGAARWMALRNIFAKVFRLRTSPLCCPVSSLLAPQSSLMFNGLPVLQEQSDEARCRVLLGADDWHLSFRTEIEVLSGPSGTQIKMTNAVQTKGLFGAFYLRLITPVHQHKITPILLNSAIVFSLNKTASLNVHCSEERVVAQKL